MKFVHGWLCGRGLREEKKQVTRCYTDTQLRRERFGVVSFFIEPKWQRVDV